jgi:hypothetical protein
MIAFFFKLIYKEDVSMDVTTSTFSPTQVILAWTLLGLLLTWLITFTVLALHAFVSKKAEWKDLPTRSKPFPAIPKPSTPAMHTQWDYLGVPASEALAEGANIESARDTGTRIS